MGNSANGIFNVLGLIVALAMVAVIVGGKNSSSVIKNMGSAFSGSIQAALGNKVA